jgi:stage III sporulation protein AA
MLDSILSILPISLRTIVSRLPQDVQAGLEEIRIRESRPLEIRSHTRHAFVSERGQLVSDEILAFIPGRDDCLSLLELLTNHSLYTFEEELKKGFITIAGGHRVGLAGRTVLEDGRVKQIRDVSFFNIRVARDIQGVGRGVVPYLHDQGTDQIHHTLIISPPGQGKTTLLRDLARLISRGHPEVAGGSAARRGFKVGIVDERSELAACIKGVPRFDLGPRTDVMDGCPKAEGMMMMIRSLSPEVIIVDEIGRAEDAVAIHEALHAGISVIATAHGVDLHNVSKRPTLKELIASQTFARFIILERRRGQEASFRILNGEGKALQPSLPHRIGSGWPS